MEICTTITSCRALIQSVKSTITSSKQPLRIGFVPTMGYLHEGHLSLVRRAKAECDFVVMSIFVNPLQFLPHEDLEKYPRDPERDRALADQAGVDMLFLPERQEMYPQAIHTKVTVSSVTDTGEGASRPGHFDGVATVVMKLFQIVSPDYAYFGLKDAQQVAVIEQMVYDLNMNVEIVACPTWREADGLAMSSRNVYLQPDERQQAVVLSQALQLVEAYSHTQNEIDPQTIIELVTTHIRTAPLAQIDYIEVRGYPSFQPFSSTGQDDRFIVALAVKFGTTRLIDNVLISVRRTPGC